MLWRPRTWRSHILIKRWSTAHVMSMTSSCGASLKCLIRYDSRLSKICCWRIDRRRRKHREAKSSERDSSPVAGLRPLHPGGMLVGGYLGHRHEEHGRSRVDFEVRPHLSRDRSGRRPGRSLLHHRGRSLRRLHVLDRRREGVGRKRRRRVDQCDDIEQPVRLHSRLQHSELYLYDGEGNRREVPMSQRILARSTAKVLTSRPSPSTTISEALARPSRSAVGKPYTQRARYRPFSWRWAVRSFCTKLALISRSPTTSRGV